MLAKVEIEFLFIKELVIVLLLRFSLLNVLLYVEVDIFISTVPALHDLLRIIESLHSFVKDRVFIHFND